LKLPNPARSPHDRQASNTRLDNSSEQDATNKDAILNFMLEKRLSDQQMILATVSVEDIKDKAALDKVTTVELSNKLSLLSKGQFQSVKSDIEEMHNQTLATPE
jgi:hypothetical protein